MDVPVPCCGFRLGHYEHTWEDQSSLFPRRPPDCDTFHDCRKRYYVCLRGQTPHYFGQEDGNLCSGIINCLLTSRNSAHLFDVHSHPLQGEGQGGDGVEPLHNSWCWMQIQSQIPMINAINKLISLMMHRSLIQLVWDRLCHAKSIQHREIVP